MGLTDTIANLYLQKGAAQAQGQERVGQLYGSLISNLGQIPGQVQQQEQQRQKAQQESQINAQRLQMGDLEIQQAKSQADAQKMLDRAYQTFGRDPSQIADYLSANGAGHLVPTFMENDAKYRKALSDAAEADAKAEEGKRNIAGRIGAEAQSYIDSSDPDALGHASGIALTRISQAQKAHQISDEDAALYIPGLDPSNPQRVKATIAAMLAASPEQAKIASERATATAATARAGRGQVVHPGDVVLGNDNKPVYTAPAKEPTLADVKPGSFEDYVLRYAQGKGKPVEQLTTADIEDARKRYQQADDRPNAATGNAQQEQANAKTVAAGIIAGDTAPSILEGTRGTAQGMALMAEIKRQGGNSDQILRNWMGTKNAIRSLNSAQQIRLAETINKASASLDRVEQLNNEWAQAAPRFGIKILNHANLKAAQNGAYGPEAASIAQRLEGQIADVTGEIGQAIMGGNSPTDHGLELAGKNISGDWSQQVLADSIKQVRYNLNLAQQARNDLLGQVGSTSTQVQTPTPSKDPLGIR